MKVLNLYAGIGGNRKLWENVEVTAVEHKQEIANIYSQFFPNDKIVVGDAHVYLEEHFDEFDFIWTSPPCPSHSRVRKANIIQNKPIFPSMKLYEEILFLEGYANCKWVVENVVSWYDPLIKPKEVGGHYFWSNFLIDAILSKPRGISGDDESIKSLQEGRFDLSKIKLGGGLDKKLLLRNCVEPYIGLHIFNSAMKVKQKAL